MAEGGTPQRSFKDSFSKTSGDADESFCDPCIHGGKWIAVEGYCQICNEYLCNSCLEVHKNQKITRSHSILHKNQTLTRQRPDTSQCLCTEICKTHHPEIIRYYCKTHDEPGCVDCMTLNHSTCKKDRVQDISDGFQATQEFKQIQQKLKRFHKEVEMMKDTLDLKHLDARYNTIQQKITSFRKQINDYLDQIQKQTTQEAAKLKKFEKTELTKLTAVNDSIKSELEEILQRIQNDSDSDSIFVLTKYAKQRLATMESEINKIKQSQKEQRHYVFRNSTEIANIISAKTPLGKLSREPNINTTASYRGYINAKTDIDTKVCCINDFALLSPDRMVAIDINNYKIKLIDVSNNRVISSRGTSSQAWRVTAFSTDQVALTVPDESKIELFNVTSTFTKQHEIQLNSRCYGIAYRDGKFAVSYLDPGRVELIDKHGEVLHTIQPKQDMDNILKKPLFIVYGHDSDTVIVSDFSTDTVSVVTLEGQIIRKYRHAALTGPCGIGITTDGVLFACNWGSGCINVVAQDFKTSNIIIKQRKYVSKPESIAYCDIKHRLYISNDIIGGGTLNDVIQVYDLNV